MDERGHCEVDWLGRCLEDSGDCCGRQTDAVINGQFVIVDCRPASDFGSVHIAGAVSLALPTLILRRLLKGNLSMPVALGYCSANDDGAKVKDEQWKSNLIVLYDENTTTTTSQVTSDDVTACTASKVVTVILDYLRKDGYRASLLQGGLKQFKAKYPHLCTDSSSMNGQQMDSCGLQSGFRNLKITAVTSEQRDESIVSNDKITVPVEVLPRLFLGDAKNASDLECLEGKGIRYILNVTPNVPNKFETNGQFKYLQIPIKDHWSQNLTTYFPQAITFIDEGRSLNRGVLVHCLAGISRSVTVTVAYLMYSMSLSLNDAYDFVKRRKPNVSPNLTFMGQLLEFENTLKVDRQLQCLCSCHTKSSSLPPSNSSPSSSSPSISSSSQQSPVIHPSSANVDSSNRGRNEVNCSSCACALNTTTSSFSSSSSLPSSDCSKTIVNNNTD